MDPDQRRERRQVMRELRLTLLIAVPLAAAGYGYMIWRAADTGDPTNIVGTSVGIAVGVAVYAGFLAWRRRRARARADDNDA